MSVEDHPNFHAVQFTVAVTAAFKDALRGDADYEAIPSDALMPFILDVVAKAEWLADASAEASRRDQGGFGEETP